MRFFYAVQRVQFVGFQLHFKSYSLLFKKLSQDIYAYVIYYVRRMRRPVVCVSRDVGASNHDLFFAGVCGTLVLIGWIRTCTCLCVSKNDVIFFLGMN